MSLDSNLNLNMSTMFLFIIIDCNIPMNNISYDISSNIFYNSSREWFIAFKLCFIWLHECNWIKIMEDMCLRRGGVAFV